MVLGACARGGEAEDANVPDAQPARDTAALDAPRLPDADPYDTALAEDAATLGPDALRLPIGDVPATPPPRTCTDPRTFPRIAGVPFTLGGQPGFRHDEGHEYGFFHTYDGLVACAGDTARKVHILLPRDYETSGRSYPVLYMNDGHTAFFTDNPIGKTWDVAGVLSELRVAVLAADKAAPLQAKIEEGLLSNRGVKRVVWAVGFVADAKLADQMKDKKADVFVRVERRAGAEFADAIVVSAFAADGRPRLYSEFAAADDKANVGRVVDAVAAALTGFAARKVITLPTSSGVRVQPSSPKRRIIGKTLLIMATSPAPTPRSTSIMTTVISPQAERKLVKRSERSVLWIACTSGITPVQATEMPRSAPPACATIGSMSARTRASMSP